MRRTNPATKYAKKSGGPKIKIREQSVLPKTDPNQYHGHFPPYFRLTNQEDSRSGVFTVWTSRGQTMPVQCRLRSDPPTYWPAHDKCKILPRSTFDQPLPNKILYTIKALYIGNLQAPKQDFRQGVDQLLGNCSSRVGQLNMCKHAGVHIPEPRERWDCPLRNPQTLAILKFAFSSDLFWKRLKGKNPESKNFRKLLRRKQSSAKISKISRNGIKASVK